MIFSREAIQLAQTLLEMKARKIYRFETPVQVGVDYCDDGTIRQSDFAFSEGEAEKLIALRLQFLGEE